MIEQEFEDFENDRSKNKNLKLMLDFESFNIQYEPREFKVLKPKLKEKFKSSVYIKNTNKNSLF